MKICDKKIAITTSIILLALAACTSSPDRKANILLNKDSLKSDVIMVDEQQLHAQYWINKLNEPNNIVMSGNDISKFNQQLFEKNPHVIDPLSLPASFTKQELLAKIDSISSVPSSERVYFDGKKVTEQDYNNYIAQLNKAEIAENNVVKFALVTKRSNLRTFPTNDAIYKVGKDRDLDRFQESAVFPGETLAVLHNSADGEWALVRAYNYLAWMRIEDFALGDKADIVNYSNSNNFIVVTGAKAFTNHVPNFPEISNVQLDMGTKLPLVPRKLYSNELYGQNPYANHIVQLPVRNSDGKLDIVFAPVPRGQDVSIGYLPYTEQNLIKQSFKFLGERYGWGHSYNGRDCTGFVGEIYKSFGILSPRNSGQQGKGKYGQNTRFIATSDTPEKSNRISKLRVGDLIYISGHVMMYIGSENDQPYVIHDVKGLGYLKPDGQLYNGTLNGVSVTPLLPLHLSLDKSYVDDIYNIKSIRTVK